MIYFLHYLIICESQGARYRGGKFGIDEIIPNSCALDITIIRTSLLQNYNEKYQKWDEMITAYQTLGKNGQRTWRNYIGHPTRPRFLYLMGILKSSARRSIFWKHTDGAKFITEKSMKSKLYIILKDPSKTPKLHFCRLEEGYGLRERMDISYEETEQAEEKNGNYETNSEKCPLDLFKKKTPPSWSIAPGENRAGRFKKTWSMPMLTILLQHTMDGDQIRVVNLILPGAGGAFSHKAPGSAMG